ncbi:MAG: hypothetical protein NTW96_16305, partial [Planctomycetia bacterium]|nr:hypothetical protein [Planctomycetia bacterium]
MKHPVMPSILLLSSLGTVLFAQDAAEQVGRRPYEMVWANRIEDTRPPLVDFENLDGWSVERKDSVASFARSREQQLWGEGVGKLVYRAQGTRPTVVARPPKPIAFPAPIDSVNFWVHGNNWDWVPDPATPKVNVALLLRSKSGQAMHVPLGNVRWVEWWLMHRRLSPEEIALLDGGGTLEGIEITGGTNKDDRTLYFDNLAFYRESLAPLTFGPRPTRGIDLPPGQGTGTNT